MPPRLNKRQLRELEELSALATEKPDPDDIQQQEEDDDEDEVVVAPTSGFSALMSQAADDDDEDEEENTTKSTKSKKSKKKKKKDSEISTPATLQAPGPSKKDKKALKKQRAKEKKDDPLDLDKALAELSLKYSDLPTAGSTSKPLDTSSRDFAALLSVNVQNLDSEVEMRKFFGSKVVAASKANASSSASPTRRQNVVQRSNLTRPKSTWWPAQLREGLSIRQLTSEENTEKSFRQSWSNFINESWWTVEYSKKYRGITLAFMQTVMSGDPDGFNNLLRALPYHADTLLQLSEVYNHREEYSTASEFVERALFSYERAFVGSFNLTNGVNRLDFDRVENRPFFLALHRQIADLQRRGCNRTAFEFSKLLYSLDPWSDPHGSLFHLDSLAIKAGMSDWLLDLWSFFESRPTEALENRFTLMALPGWWYARALALRTKGSDGTKALTEAIGRFPSVLPLLADKIDLSLSVEIRGHPNFRIHTDASTLSNQPEAIVQLLCHLYVQRAVLSWKKPDLVQWLSSTVKSMTPFSQPPAPSPLFSAPTLQYSIYRHVMVLEQSCRRLFSFLPKQILNSRQIACDPLPPPTRINEYDTEFFKGAEDVLSLSAGSRPNRRNAQRMLEQLIPDPVFRRQLQEFFDMHPQFAARFPGGIVQFAQIAANLPEDALEDMMIAETENMRGEPVNREMPGQIPGQIMLPPDLDEEVLDANGEGDDVEEDLSEDEEEVAPLPVRLLRTVVNRFWGTAEPAPDTDSEDEY